MVGCERRIESKLFKTHQKRLIRPFWAFNLISILIVSLVPGDDVADAEPLKVSSVMIVRAPSNGAVTITPVDGLIQYTPETRF